MRGRNGHRRFKEGTLVDLATGGVGKIAPMSVACSGFSLASLQGCLYAVGGYNDTTILKSFERYNPVKDQCTEGWYREGGRDFSPDLFLPIMIWGICGTQLEGIPPWNPQESLSGGSFGFWKSAWQ